MSLASFDADRRFLRSFNTFTVARDHTEKKDYGFQNVFFVRCFCIASFFLFKVVPVVVRATTLALTPADRSFRR